MKELEAQLLDAERVLDTEYSFDLAEPNYRACIGLIDKLPGHQKDFSDLLIRMYVGKKISDEPVAYLMHVLRWPEVREWAAKSLREDQTAIATGAGRANILSAYSDDWDNRDFYQF